ncbi:MAG TPA: hypothetical protein VKA74_10865 [Myxococcota bacterium]|nr:hypothetical protein [Myxococcota bacterium]
MSVQQELARRHLHSLIEEAQGAGVPIDVIGRALLAQLVELWKQHRDEEDIASELRFTADSLGADTDFTFMRP